MAVNSSGEDGARFQKGYNNSPLLEDNHEPTYFINNNIFPRLCLLTKITVIKTTLRLACYSSRLRRAQHHSYNKVSIPDPSQPRRQCPRTHPAGP